MKRVFLSLGLLAFHTIVFGKVWIVDNNSGNFARDFTTIQAAHDGAQAGDTLYVVGSGTNYGNLTLTKQLVIIGPGYFLSENPNNQASFADARVGQNTGANGIIIQPGASGTIILGMTMFGVVVNANNVVLERNNISNIAAIVCVTVNADNVIIRRNYMVKVPQGCVQVSNGRSNILVENNFMDAGTAVVAPAFSQIGTSTVKVNNNVIRGNVSFQGSAYEFNNNIWISGSYAGSASIPRNNLVNGTQLPASNGNQQNVNMSNVFVGGTSPDGQYQLRTNSPAIGAGVNGADCGMFGGAEPYILSGIPAIPTIYQATIPTSGVNSLPVQIKIKSQN